MIRHTLLVTLLATGLAAAPVAARAAAPVAPAAPAAEPAPALTPDAAFAALKSYTYDQPARVLRYLEAYIQRATGSAEDRRDAAGRLAAVLRDPDATLDAKRFACQWLPLVAGNEQVLLLEQMLDDEKTLEMARRALQAIPGEASLEVLREVLGGAKGDHLVGILNALGAQRDAASAGSIAAHLESKDQAVSAAAAAAIGEIGTIEAADALTAAAKSAQGDRAETLLAARLRCAQRLGETGLAHIDAPRCERAVAMLSEIFSADLPARWRIAAMMGIVRIGGEWGAWAVLEALEDKNPTVRAAAIQATRRIPGKAGTEKLVGILPTLTPRDQVLMLGVLADRAGAADRPLDREYADARLGVLKMLDAGAAAVCAAAVRALGAVGSADDVPRLVAIAASSEKAVRDAAREALARLNAGGVGAAVIAAARQGEPATRVEAIRALAARRSEGAGEVLLAAAAEGNAPAVRAAALAALAEIGRPDDYARLVGLLAGVDDANVAASAERAAVAVGQRVAEAKARVEPVRKAMAGASPGAAERLLDVLAAFGGAEALEVLRPCLKADDTAVRTAAVRALSRWLDASAADALLALAREAGAPVHRQLALRGYLRLAGQTKDASARLRMFSAAKDVATTADAKKMLLAGLAGLSGPEALAMAQTFLDDPEVKPEAQAAVTRIRAAAKPKPQPKRAAVPPADPDRLAARRKELADAAPYGFHLVCYMDCGPQTATGEKGKPGLRVTSGAPYFWGGSDAAADVRYGTIVFTDREVVFEAAGLDPKRAYRLGFSWWDYDHATRAQSVWAAPLKEGRPVRLMETARLPSGAQGQKPAEKAVPLPHDLTAAGSVRVLFRNEAQPNVVVSEVWLWESDTASAPADAAPEASGEAAAEPKVHRSSRSGGARVLLVTGIDHPGHKWRETAPVLREAIEKDERLAVDIVEDPGWLETGDLAPYKVVVHHWMDWKVPPPGPKARTNLDRFVRGGRGLVLVHFGCGAWQDWPGFVQLAGRVWDPDLRAHDPRGTFTVDIVDAEHPITRGLKAFETTDELYTCLAGAREIHVLAKATSKVDQKDYPMAFVLTYGQGRVFHCVLGHDVKAFEPEPVKTLYRRGAAWAAGLDPTAKP